MEKPGIQSFRISIPDARLDRLRAKLVLTEFPSELDSDIRSPLSRGPSLAEMRRLTEYWRDGFDWRQAEAELNERLPQFTVSISVDDPDASSSSSGASRPYVVHFVHFRSPVASAIPLIFLHVWPGSFLEAGKIAPALAGGDGVATPAFHVVAPSLIDHGFSSGSGTAGFHIEQHAAVAHGVMRALGYDQYVAQGGDTGYLVARTLAQRYPAHCVAHHVNMAVPAEPSPTRHPEVFARWQAAGGFAGLDEAERAALARARAFQAEGSGYFAIHTTRPLALAYAMTDSPVGLLAWILDKLRLWTDDFAWTPDEILTWVCIYYFSTAGPAASFNTYYANQHRTPQTAFEQAVEYASVPLGVSRFPKEILSMPKVWNATMGPVVFEAEHGRGGHFAAFEGPDLLVGDLRKMFGKGGGAYNAVKGASGYR